MRKILMIAASALLLTACSSAQDAKNLYADETNGGWRDDIDITELGATARTKAMQKTGHDVVYFNFNEANLDTNAKTTLQQQVEWLKNNPTALVVIEGRCDERGTREYNLALGDKRANAARSYLMAKGIAENRIRTISYGKDKPVVLGSTEEAWAQNRTATTVAY